MEGRMESPKSAKRKLLDDVSSQLERSSPSKKSKTNSVYQNILTFWGGLQYGHTTEQVKLRKTGLQITGSGYSEGRSQPNLQGEDKGTCGKFGQLKRTGGGI